MSVVGDWAALGETRHELGEGARWIDSEFVFVDLLAGTLLSTTGDPNASPITRMSLDIPLGAVARCAGGGWIAAAGTGIAMLDESSTDLRWQARLFDDSPVPMRMNDGVADRHGRFWAGAMPYDGTPDAGCLIRVDPGGEVRVILDGLTVPNGPAFSPDGSMMYLADSARGIILRYRVDSAGNLGAHPDVFATIDDASPDGMTVDTEGCLWSALWGGGRIHRYSPDGDLVDVIPVPASQPTSIALSAQAPGRILVTTAAHGIADPGPLDGATLIASTTAQGFPAAEFGG